MALFKARARALDMLGRQQIAGIPTAISELFKNAHDAYATHAEADFYRPERIFVLRDDGIGMSLEDFVERWLTIGTESKLDAAHGLKPPPGDGRRRSRPIMGEKGIGRLAIATLGPQVLVLTRAKRAKDKDELVAAFINWELFACPGLDLSDIDIPVKTFKAGTLPTKQQLAELVREAIENVKALRAKLEPETALGILKNMQAFDVDVKRFFEARLTVAGDGHGTAFLIHPVDENLKADLDEDPDTGVSPLVRMLIGFSNALSPTADKEDRLVVEFRDHRTADDVQSMIGDSEFFTQDDFQNADHRIVGEFDGKGRFRGTVAVYDDKPKKYELDPPSGKDRTTACGPFRLSFAYVQGELSSTRLDPAEHGRLTTKLQKVGGLYIYRDGIRVLPYGNSDFDFLDIEQRRSRNAGRYFFSYRRMFGAIEITRGANPELEEKAGREGFRANRAYREFKGLLERFLVQLAAEFFREGGERSQAWEEKREELEKNDLLRKDRESQAKATRNQLQTQLDAVFAEIETKAAQKATKALLDDAKQRLRDAANRAAAEANADRVLDVETTLRNQLQVLRASYVVERPKGFALSPRLQEDWSAYVAQFKTLDEKVFGPTVEALDELVADAASTAKVAVDLRQRAERALQDEIKSARKKATALSGEVSTLASRIHDRTTRRVQTALETLERTVADALAAFAASGKVGEKFAAKRDTFAERIEAVATEQLQVLTELRDQLTAIDLDAAPGTTSNRASLMEAMEEELIVLRERADEALGIAQLGMAVEVISHEFAASIKGVRHSLRRLKSWSDANESLVPVYEELRTSFDHLDGYLSLFTPLSRRLVRRQVEIHGSDVAEYLQNLFEERLTRHEIELRATKAFRGMTVRGLPSTFYPVFVNLVDNALYWVSDRPKPRLVELDYGKGTMTISDSGPGVPARDRERIFERGFTRKTGGQGLGLYIARAVLERNGYSLGLAEDARAGGAKFEIRPQAEGK